MSDQPDFFLVRDKRSDLFYWITHEFYDRFASRLGVTGIGVYNALCRYAHFRTRECWVKQSTIADDLGISRQTVNRQLNFMKQIRLIDIEPGGQGRPCIYHLLNLPSEDDLQGVDNSVNNPVENSKESDQGCQTGRQGVSRTATGGVAYGDSIKENTLKRESIKDQEASPIIFLKDLEIDGLSQPNLEALFQACLKLFLVRGWDISTDMPQKAFLAVAERVSEYKPQNPYAYFQQALNRHLNENAELYAEQSRINRCKRESEESKKNRPRFQK